MSAVAGTLRQRGRFGGGARTQARNAILAGLMVFLAFYPFLDGLFRWGKLGSFLPILIFTLLALGLNVVVGYAGLLDLGYVAFFAIGGYTAAFLTSPNSVLAGFFQTNFYVAMALSFVVAALFGVILGAPTLRLRGDYLAIVTLAFGEIVPRAFLNLEQWTKGSRGMNPIGRPAVPMLESGQLTVRELTTSDQMGWYYTVFVVGCLSVFAIYRLAHSRIGRAWMAMREDELAASAMGIDLVQTKLLAFAIGASFSGFAGCLWASMLQVIDPSQFDFSISIIVLAMVILGGIGNIWGVIFGGVVLGFYDRVLTSEATNWLHAIAAAVPIPVLSPFLQSVHLENYKFGIFGAALVILMLTRPEGMFPTRQRQVEMRGGAEEADVDLLGEEAMVDKPVGGVRA